MIRVRRRLLLLVAALLLLPGCVSLPESGPVVEVGDERPRPQGPAGVDFDPPPPRAGAEPREIVASFMEAMLAAPAELSQAKAYLTEEAAREWSPASTIVYGGYQISSGSGALEIGLEDAIRIDARGRWRGPMSPAQSRISLSVVLEDGQWRIDELPQALLVNRVFFDSRFVRSAVYWFDPAGGALVPEPVYVPGGDGMPTALVRSLLLGPPPRLRGVVRSFLPPDLTTSGVVVDSSGRATIRLPTEFPDLVRGELERAITQIAWTLRGVPGVVSVRISGAEEPVQLLDGSTEIDVQQGTTFDPIGGLGAGVLFALRRGRLVYDGLGEMAPVSGVVGAERTGWRAFAVEPDGRRVAGVGRSGTTLDLAPVQVEGEPQRVLQGLVDLLPPAWDAVGGLWVIDRTDQGAEVYLSSAPDSRMLSVPGITGSRVRAFVVSRDGSQLVAVLRGAEGDRVVVARVARDRRGRVEKVLPARTVYAGTGTPVRIQDLAWRTPTSVLVLLAPSGDVSQVREVSLDGSTEVAGSSLSTVPGRMRRLAGSPLEDEPAFAMGADGVRGIDGAPVPVLPSDLRVDTLSYPG